MRVQFNTSERQQSFERFLGSAFFSNSLKIYVFTCTLNQLHLFPIQWPHFPELNPKHMLWTTQPMQYHLTPTSYACLVPCALVRHQLSLLELIEGTSHQAQFNVQIVSYLIRGSSGERLAAKDWQDKKGHGYKCVWVLQTRQKQQALLNMSQTKKIEEHST